MFSLLYCGVLDELHAIYINEKTCSQLSSLYVSKTAQLPLMWVGEPDFEPRSMMAAEGTDHRPEIEITKVRFVG